MGNSRFPLCLEGDIKCGGIALAGGTARGTGLHPVARAGRAGVARQAVGAARRACVPAAAWGGPWAWLPLNPSVCRALGRGLTTKNR
jgi:hypothetical protein